VLGGALYLSCRRIPVLGSNILPNPAPSLRRSLEGCALRETSFGFDSHHPHSATGPGMRSASMGPSFGRDGMAPGPDPAAAADAAAMASMRVTERLPTNARLGRAAIGRWRVDAPAADRALNLQQIWSPGATGHPLPAGEYTVLTIGGAYSMCDAPFMLRNYVPFVQSAAGDILLTGLGLGCLVGALAARPAVRSITVLEIDPDVLGLIGPHVRHRGVELISADALAWRPPDGRRFDAAMLDIDDDTELISRLVRHHSPWVTALWPDPAELGDGPLTPDLIHLLRQARSAVS
jgi:hypothetical protein